MTEPRKMPTKKAIKDFWAEHLVKIGKFDSVEELAEADYCFACGMEEKTERCHIMPRFNQGSDDVSNLHLLCSDCHKSSEFLFGEMYETWLAKTNVVTRLLGTENQGITIFDVIKKLATS
jgi:hypothetical protein